jgi:hypothetical protein
MIEPIKWNQQRLLLVVPFETLWLDPTFCFVFIFGYTSQLCNGGVCPDGRSTST